MAHKQEPTRNFAITRRTCSLVEVEVCRYIKTESGSEVDSKLRYYFIAGEPLRSRGPFLECPDNFMGPKSFFMLAVFAFKIKVSIILKMIR